MQKPRLIASDLDGTLLRDDGSVSSRTRTALKRVEAANVVFILVTGRPIRRMREIADALGFEGVAICGNGSIVYDMKREQVVQQTLLTADDARALIADLRAHLPEIAFAVETGHKLGREPAYAQFRPVNVALDVEFADALDLAAGGASKLIARHPLLPIDEFMARAKEIVADRATVTHAGAPFLEIAAAGVTKAWALAAYCDRLGIGPHEVLAFGDMPNDLPLLEWAGHSVAVANAHPSVLEAADETTASNEDDGVAAFLETLRLD